MELWEDFTNKSVAKKRRLRAASSSSPRRCTTFALLLSDLGCSWRMVSRGDMPREAAAVAAVLRAQGATEWEPRVVAQLLEFSYRHVAEVLQEAQHYAAHRTREPPGAAPLTLADVRLAAQSALTHTFTEPLGGDELARIIKPLNDAPLPPVPTRSGLVLPPEGTLLVPTFQAWPAWRAACPSCSRLRVTYTRRYCRRPGPWRRRKLPRLRRRRCRLPTCRLLLRGNSCLPPSEHA